MHLSHGDIMAVVVVTTNYRSLKYLCDQQDLMGRKARWTELIQAHYNIPW